ncbi:hypothetical protein BASA83_010193 [Batrachochytrium salamandrivorans]|nr:hypothetical protein BASA83_010193 [Batrachochytrium salamandrivorans]
MASISFIILDILSHPPGSRWIQRKLTQCKIGQYQPRSMISKSSSDLPISIGGYQVRLESGYRGLIQALKKAFKDNVILTHADESQEFLVEVDASDFAVAGVLSQYNNQRDLQPGSILFQADGFQQNGTTRSMIRNSWRSQSV